MQVVYDNGRISRDASGSYEYYHSEGVGSTRQLSNDSQSVTQTTTYDAFGNIESSAGTSNNAYKYAGQWFYRNDGDDGLMHVGARYYDPLVGRFITADPIHYGPNWYIYANNDPVNLVDPKGHKPSPAGGLLHFAEGIGIGATGVGVIAGGATTTTTVTTTTTTTTTGILWGLYTKTIVAETAAETTTAIVGGSALVTGVGVAAVVVGIALAAYGAYEVSDWWVNNTNWGQGVTDWLGNVIYKITDGR